MKQYIEIFKKENIVYKLLTLLIIAVTILFLGRVIKNTIVGLDYPNEVLEPANVNLTNAILQGRVPYDKANLVVPGEQEPPINYEYPFLNSVVAAVFTLLFAGNTVLAHYFVSFASMIGTAILGSIMINRYSRTTLGPTTAFLLLMFCHWRYGYISASPDGFGLFVAMLTLFIACTPKIKYRTLWCSIGTVAAFYTKQYYAAICISIFIYFFLYSKKEAFKYFGWCVALLAASIAIITWKWPLFWTYSILLLMHGCFQGWNAAGFVYLFEQMKYLAAVFIGLIIVLVVALVQFLKKRKKQENKEAKEKIIKEGDVLPLFLIQLPVQMIALFIFGRNDGAYLTYFLQLLIPSIVMVTFLITEMMDIPRYKGIFVCGYSALVLLSIYFGWSKLPMHMLGKDEIDNWESAYALVDEYRIKGDVYHYQATAYNAIEHGDSLMSTGHDGDINQANYDEWRSSDVQQVIFPDAGNVYKENLDYRDVIAKQIRNRDIAMVVTEQYGNIYITADELRSAGYTIKRMIPLQFGNMEYDVYFWVCD